MTALEIGLYHDATPDEQIAYSMGWNTATAIARTEAFAAIRRAAAVARKHDIVARHAINHLYEAHKRKDAVAIRRLEVQVNEQTRIAGRVRYAIRAAIGSEKAS